MNNMNEDHTFVVCAYKQSTFLEKCIISLKNQTVKSNIIVVTSTPNDFIKKVTDKYKICLYVNEGEGGIVQDWNFGYSKANTKYVTIAHQDDVYFEKYTETILYNLEQEQKPLIAFTDYYEVRNERYVRANKLLRIKRLMLLPMRRKSFRKSIFIRRRILSLGSPICCPSVTYARENLPVPIFTVGFRSNEDWEAWEKLSKLKGSFIYCPEALMGHRIHEDSETTAIISDNKRSDEDLIMYRKFWPEPIAKLLVSFYAKSQESNNI